LAAYGYAYGHRYGYGPSPLIIERKLGALSSPFSRTSEKVNSAKFAMTEFSEVRFQLAKSSRKKARTPPRIHPKFIGSCFAKCSSTLGRAGPKKEDCRQ
jgi:hypothetical protein